MYITQGAGLAQGTGVLAGEPAAEILNPHSASQDRGYQYHPECMWLNRVTCPAICAVLGNLHNSEVSPERGDW